MHTLTFFLCRKKPARVFGKEIRTDGHLKAEIMVSVCERVVEYFRYYLLGNEVKLSSDSVQLVAPTNIEKNLS